MSNLDSESGAGALGIKRPVLYFARESFRSMRSSCQQSQSRNSTLELPSTQSGTM